MKEVIDYKHLLLTNTFDREHIGTIGIPTKDRPASLRRLLDSITLDQVADFNGKIIIADSSIKFREECGDIVNSTASRLTCEVLHRQPNDTEKMIARLHTLIDMELEMLRINFLGFPHIFSAGAARNELLLLQHGKSGIQIDDDIILNYRKKTNFSSELVITEQAPLLVSTFTNNRVVAENLEPVMTNPLTQYEDFFNSERKASKLIPPDAVDVILKNRLHHRNAHILSIQSGLYGNSCVQRLFAIGQDPKINPSFFPTSLSQYNEQKHSTHVIQSAVAPSITDNPLCIAAYIAIRGDKLFPPFPPIGRGEDFLTGVLGSQCCVGSFSLHLGTLVEHARDGIIPSPKISALALPPSNRILAGIIAQETYAGSTEENLMRAGSLIRSFSDANIDTFREYLIGQSKEVWKASLGMLEERLLANNDAPNHWKTDIEEYIQELENSLLRSPREIAGQVGSDEMWNNIQNGYRAYGRLLESWPTMWRISLDKNLV